MRHVESKMGARGEKADSHEARASSYAVRCRMNRQSSTQSNQGLESIVGISCSHLTIPLEAFGVTFLVSGGCPSSKWKAWREMKWEKILKNVVDMK